MVPDAAPKLIIIDMEPGTRVVKLYSSSNSPWVRKVAVVAAECGLDDRITLIPTDTRIADVTLTGPDNALPDVNPIAKIPTLITDDGTPLYDSAVICEYLDQLDGTPKLFQAAGPARWTALRRAALGDEIINAAHLIVIEYRRPQAVQIPGWLRHQQAKIDRGLDQLDAEADTFGDGIDIGLITIGCALGFLSDRFRARPWHLSRPALAKWFKEFEARPSMAATKPVAADASSKAPEAKLQSQIQANLR